MFKMENVKKNKNIKCINKIYYSILKDGISLCESFQIAGEFHKSWIFFFAQYKITENLIKISKI